jgi:multidrug efflux system outer membrane protein
LALSVILAGCAVGPNYKRPQTDLPEHFRFEPIPAGSNSIAELPWWEVFKDDKLQELIRTAFTNNYDLRIAIARREQTRAVVEQARAGLLPQFNYAGSISRGKNALGGQPVFNEGQAENNYFIAGTASWEVDLWGRVRRLHEASQAQFLSTEEARHGVMVSVLSEVATAYFQLLALDRQLEVAKAASNSFAESLQIFNQRLEAGVASKLEAARAEASMASAAATVPDFERQIAVQENVLSVLIGRKPGPVSRKAKLLDEVMPEQAPGGLPSELLRRRPDIRQNEELLRAANARIGAAVADFFPQFTLTSLIGQVSPELSVFTSGGANAWSIAANVAGPIFRGGQLRGQYHQRKAEWDEARLQYEAGVLNALQEVSNALIGREKFGQASIVQDRAVKANEVAVEVSMQRYVAGKAGYFELLEAQQQLFPAQNTLVQTHLNQVLAVVQLYRALGGGWERQESTNTATTSSTK